MRRYRTFTTRRLQISTPGCRRESKKEVNKFPAEQRSIARRYVEPLLQRLHGEHPERVSLVMEGMFDSLARNQFCSVLELLERSGLSSAVDALKDFNNINLLQMLSNIAKRVKVLNELDDLCANPLTVERSVHDLITSNVWVLGRDTRPSHPIEPSPACSELAWRNAALAPSCDPICSSVVYIRTNICWSSSSIPSNCSPVMMKHKR